MAIPLVPNKKNILGSLTSAGDVGSGGTPAVGQQFDTQKSSTDFVNAKSLLDANAGKGQSMLDDATKGQVDTTADFSELDVVKGYDPASQLRRTTTSDSETTQNTGKDAAGNTTHWSTTAVTPKTTTTYGGLSTSDIDTKKAGIDKLRLQFNDLGNQFADNPSGVNLRQQAQQKNVASKNTDILCTTGRLRLLSNGE